MRNTKTTLKELTARYRAVLKKCFLINAGLLIALPAMAEEITWTEGSKTFTDYTTISNVEIAKDKTLEITSNYGGFGVDENGDEETIGSDLYVENKIAVDGTLSLNTANIASPTIQVNGGTLNFSDSLLQSVSNPNENPMILENATVNLVRSDVQANDIAFKNTDLTFENDSVDDGFGFWSWNNTDIVGSNTVKATEGWNYLGSDHALNIGDGTTETSLNITEGQVYLDSNGNAIVVKDNASLNVAKGAAVFAVQSDTIGSESEKLRTFSLEGGTINLEGAITGKISSVKPGTININDSDATINGRVGDINSTIALNINKDYTISNIKDFENLESLNIADGTKLTYDHSYDTTTQSKRVESVDLQGDMDITTRLDVTNTLTVQDDSQLDVHGELNVMDGDFNMTGGQVNIFGAPENEETGVENGLLWANNVNISGGTLTMSGTDANMDTLWDWDGKDKPEGYKGDITITDKGQVNVTATNANIFTDNNGTFSVANGGVLTVAKEAKLHTKIDEDLPGTKTTIHLLENGTINVAGTLESHVAAGDTAGTLNITDSAAKIDGLVSGVNVRFDSAYNVNNLILSGLNEVTVNATDVVWTETEAQSVQGLLVTDNGGLTLSGNWEGSHDYSDDGKKFHIAEALTNNGSLAFSNLVIEPAGDINTSGTLALHNAVLNNGNTINKPVVTNVNITGGVVTLTGESQFEADSDKGVMTITDGSITLKDKGEMGGSVVNINGGTILLDTEKDLLAETELTMTGGAVSIQNGALVSRDTFNMSGGSVVLDNTGSGYDDLRAVGGNKFTLSGGTIDVYGGNALREGDDNVMKVGDNIIIGDTIDITGGSLNVSGKLYTTKVLDDSDTYQTSTVNITNKGVLNLAGAIKGDITGDSDLNITNTNAQVMGNVSGINLNAVSDYNLSGVTGTIGDLAGLTAHKSLTVDKELGTVANLTVKDNATLTLSKNVTATNTALGAGTLDLGTSKLTTDKLTVADNGTVAFQVSAKDTFGSVAANTYDVSETGTNLVLTLDTGVLAENETQNFAIFTDKDGTAQKVDFANLSENARYTFVQKEDGTYDITQTTSINDVVTESGGDDNTQSTTDAWLGAEEMPENSGAKLIQDHLNKLSQLSGDAFVKAAEALMPEVAPVVHSITQALNNQIANVIQTRFGTTPAPQGRNGGDTLKPGSVWAQGLYNKSKLDTAAGFDGKTHGLAIGADGFVNDDLKVGFGYAYSTSDIDSTGRSTDVDTHSAIAYGEYTMGNAFVNGLATYSRSSYDENKDVAGLPVKADYDMDAIFGQVMTGYNVQTNWATVTPEAGLRYLWTKTHGYTDTADQHVKGDTMNTLTGVAGLRLGTNKKVQDFVLKPAVSLHATYDIVDDESASTVQLANGAAYTVQGESLERFGIEAGAQLGASFGNVDVSLDYMGRFRKDYTDHTGMLNLKYNF